MSCIIVALIREGSPDAGLILCQMMELKFKLLETIKRVFALDCIATAWNALFPAWMRLESTGSATDGDFFHVQSASY